MAKRGPGYPAFGLKEALARARALYDQDGSAQTAPEVAVKAWGYGGLNGASLRVLAGLRHYGLLEGTGDTVKLTQRALTILLEPIESRERAEAIQEAAQAPDIFGQILAEYQGKLPSDAAIISYLVRKQGFHEKAAQSLVEAFRETVGLAEESHVPHYAEDSAGVGAVAAAARPSVERPEPRRAAPSTQGGNVPFNWPLRENQVVTVSFTSAPVQADIERLRKYLDIAKEALPNPKAEAPMSAGSVIMGESG